VRSPISWHVTTRSSDGIRHTVKVPKEVELTVEIEVGDDNEIEVELKW
jgi:hypothetical protein